MTLQNVRSLLWRGEDLGSTGAGTRELTIPTQVAATARPQIQSLAFVGSVSISGFMGAAQSSVLVGQNRIILNKSPDYWVTILCTINNGGTPQPAHFAIPPLGIMFVPANAYSSVTQAAQVVMNSTWPIPMPLAGTGYPTVPQATTQTVLTVDLIQEM